MVVDLLEDLTDMSTISVHRTLRQGFFDDDNCIVVVISTAPRVFAGSKWWIDPD